MYFLQDISLENCSDQNKKFWYYHFEEKKLITLVLHIAIDE